MSKVIKRLDLFFRRKDFIAHFNPAYIIRGTFIFKFDTVEGVFSVIIPTVPPYVGIKLRYQKAIRPFVMRWGNCGEQFDCTQDAAISSIAVHFGYCTVIDFNIVCMSAPVITVVWSFNIRWDIIGHIIAINQGQI